MHRIVSSGNKFILTSSFLVCICIISFICFIALATRSEKNELVFFLILVQTFWVSSLLGWLWLWVSCILPLLCWNISPLSLCSPWLFFLSQIDTVFSQRSFMNQMVWSSFYPLVHVCGGLCFLIYICWPFLPLLIWIWLDMMWNLFVLLNLACKYLMNNFCIYGYLRFWSIIYLLGVCCLVLTSGLDYLQITSC